jgi:hypothetical protein
MASAPAVSAQKVGAWRIEVEDRVARLTGPKGPVRIAAFAGPAFAPPSQVALDAVAEAKPQLALMLGGLGDDEKTATATAAALAKCKWPTLVLGGGRDAPARLALLKDNANVLDISAFRRIEVAGHVFIPIAGSFDGRQSLAADACGHGLSDLKEIASELGEAAEGESRWLLSWQAPQGGAAATPDGLDLGVPDIAELARRVGARGGLFGWPHAQVGRAVGKALSLVVPRLDGPVMERADGTRMRPGFALIVATKDTLGLEGVQPTLAP